MTPQRCHHDPTEVASHSFHYFGGLVLVRLPVQRVPGAEHLIEVQHLLMVGEDPGYHGGHTIELTTLSLAQIVFIPSTSRTRANVIILLKRTSLNNTFPSCTALLSYALHLPSPLPSFYPFSLPLSLPSIPFLLPHSLVVKACWDTQVMAVPSQIVPFVHINAIPLVGYNLAQRSKVNYSHHAAHLIKIALLLWPALVRPVTLQVLR